MSFAPPRIEVKDVHQFKVLRDFFKKECERNPRLQMLPYDEPRNASVGYVVFAPPRDANDSPLDLDENELAFELVFAERPAIDEVTRAPLGEEELAMANELLLRPEDFDFDKLLETCITQKGFIRADDPKNRRLGFAKYGSSGSVIRYFCLREFKVSPPELQERVNKWREQRPFGEYRKFAAQMLGVDECP